MHIDPALARASAPSVQDWQRALTEAEAADFGELFPTAFELVQREGRASTAVLEARLNIGYCRAARIVDAMERIGLIPRQICARPRAVA